VKSERTLFGFVLNKKEHSTKRKKSKSTSEQTRTKHAFTLYHLSLFFCSLVLLSFFNSYLLVVYWCCVICSFVLFIQLQMKGKGMRELNKGTKTTTGFRV